MMKHKHCELIKAWADGAQFQYRMNGGVWSDTQHPQWHEFEEYRIKPEPVVLYVNEYKERGVEFCCLYETAEQARDCASRIPKGDYIRTIKLMEVEDEA